MNKIEITNVLTLVVIYVLYVHGGNTSYANTKFCNPAIYRVVLFDQCGAGKSMPAAELRTNTCQHLVSDIEVLRRQAPPNSDIAPALRGFVGFNTVPTLCTSLPRIGRFPDSTGNLHCQEIYTSFLRPGHANVFVGTWHAGQTVRDL